MYCVYILKSTINGSYYIGSCRDINERLDRHNNGLVISTKRYAPWNVIYQESFKNLLDARSRELQIKSWKKRRAIERLIQRS